MEMAWRLGLAQRHLGHGAAGKGEQRTESLNVCVG